MNNFVEMTHTFEKFPPGIPHADCSEGLITKKIPYEISKSWDFAKDFRISGKISRFHGDFKISGKISRFQERFQDFMEISRFHGDFKISGKISRFQERFQDFMEISRFHLRFPDFSEDFCKISRFQ